MLLNVNSPIKNELVMLEQQLKNFENNKTLIKVMDENTHLYKIKSLEMEIKKSLDKEIVS